MSILAQAFRNQVLWVTLAAWLAAQSIKILLEIRREHRFDSRWIMGTGGMPSAHSAGVAALATSVGLKSGFDTVNFAVALIFALVTMFDAQGVRRAAGRQAAILNKIIDEFNVSGQISEGRLKELLGHTPTEVVAGGLVGCFLAILLCRP